MNKDKRILIFFPHNIFINSAGCHTRCWSLIDFFERNQFDVFFCSIKECEVYPWNDDFIIKASKYFSKSLILSNTDDLKSKFISFAKDINPTHVLINYYNYSFLIEDEYFKNIKKICEIHDIIEHNTYMFDKISLMIDGGFFGAKKNNEEYIYCNKDILNINFIDQKELDNIRLNNIRSLLLYDLILCISENEKIFLNKKGFKNSIFFSYSKDIMKNDVCDKTFDIDPIFVGSMNPFNLQAYFILRDSLKFNNKINIIGSICNNIDRNIRFNNFGVVDDLRFFYKKTKFSLCPIVSGTGTKIKILESMINCTPVVSTKSSSVSTPIEDNYNGFISDNWDEFKLKSNELYNNKDLCIKFSKNAKKSITEFISFEENYKKIKDWL